MDISAFLKQFSIEIGKTLSQPSLIYLAASMRLAGLPYSTPAETSFKMCAMKILSVHSQLFAHFLTEFKMCTLA